MIEHAAEIIPWAFSLIGTLLLAIAVMIYRRLGRMEDSLVRTEERHQMDKDAMHVRITSVDTNSRERDSGLSSRLGQVEAVCAARHAD